MATTASIDYDRLNEAAQIVFDVAKARGEHEGGERERLKAAAAHADSTLTAAGVFANLALDELRANGQEAAAFYVMWTNRMLGQTPLLAERHTMTAHGLMDRHGITSERIVSALSSIHAARVQLREHYDGLGEIR